MENQTETPAPAKKRIGRPPRPNEFDALFNILKYLKPLSVEQRDRVMQTATTWLAATNTNDPANQ